MLLATILFSAPGIARADCSPPSDGPPLCLAGTVTSPDFTVALVEHPGEPGDTRLRQGDTIGEWSVVEIGPSYVTLQHDDQTARLALRDDLPKPATPQQAAAPAGPQLRGIKQGPMRHPQTKAARGEKPDD